MFNKCLGPKSKMIQEIVRQVCVSREVYLLSFSGYDQEVIITLLCNMEKKTSTNKGSGSCLSAFGHESQAFLCFLSLIFKVYLPFLVDHLTAVQLYS